ncbi:MAG: cyclic-di-AMP receptor [Peptostreptococcaceae bacterium]|nr:cyclic-di-AMP receptor [Peptostreptococcaceae bacterium]
MKMITVIIHDEDSKELLKKLNEKEFGVTKLASTGGFLRSGNTTLLIGVSKEQVDEVLEMIKVTCKKRRQLTTTAPVGANTSNFVVLPLEVTVGGATVFITDVEHYAKY